MALYHLTTIHSVNDEKDKAATLRCFDAAIAQRKEDLKAAPACQS